MLFDIIHCQVVLNNSLTIWNFTKLPQFSFIYAIAGDQSNPLVKLGNGTIEAKIWIWATKEYPPRPFVFCCDILPLTVVVAWKYFERCLEAMPVTGFKWLQCKLLQPIKMLDKKDVDNK